MTELLTKVYAYDASFDGAFSTAWVTKRQRPCHNSGRLTTAVARVRSQVRSGQVMWDVAEELELGQFSASTSGFPCQFSFHQNDSHSSVIRV
jgi:hypothetical protein